jgi:hypothetical protein
VAARYPCVRSGVVAEPMKTKKPHFGKRGVEKVEEAERKPTVMERLKMASSRLWGKKVGQKKKPARPKGFKH